MRKLTVLLGVAAVLAMTAGPAGAKGGGEDTSRSYVRITGPGIGLPIEFSGPTGGGFYSMSDEQAAADLDLVLAGTGAGGGCYGCTSYYDTHAPKDQSTLGPRYLVEYYRFPCCQAGEVFQALYPFAPGGPWTFTPSFQGAEATDLLGQPIGVHWFHASGRLGTRFLQLLEAHGLPKHAILGVAGTAATTTRQPSRPWAVGLAIAAVLALLTIGALASRRATVRPA